MNDEIDEKLLTILQQDARTSNAEIARQLGMAPSAIFERIRKLEARGVITGYETRLNPRALEAGLLAFVSVRDEGAYGTLETGAALAAIPEVQEVHNVAGEDCYLVKVRVADTEALARLLRESFGAIPSIRSTRTTIVLDTLKETGQINLKRTERAMVEKDREERPDGER
jgi:Lrp/AsnC family transcriptional regulator, leucine-responsive regulatory protein